MHSPRNFSGAVDRERSAAAGLGGSFSHAASA
jgi:hypothetical protein